MSPACHEPRYVLERRYDVEAPRLPAGMPDLAEQRRRDDRHHKRHRSEHHEDRMPAPYVDEHAGDGGPDRRGESDDEPRDAHRLAVFARRVERKRHHLDEREQDARTARVEQARREQQPVVRREERRGASDDEDADRDEKQRLGVDAVDEKRRYRGDEPQREDVGGGEQLAQRGVDGELAHDGGQRRDHHALRDARRARPQHHDAQDQMAHVRGERGGGLAVRRAFAPVIDLSFLACHGPILAAFSRRRETPGASGGGTIRDAGSSERRG